MSVIPMTTLEWDDKPEVQKGDYGEILARKTFEAKGYSMYAPVNMGAHSVDMLALNDGIICFALEVKTKPMCRKYPETGINYYQYQRYRQFMINNSLPLYVAFVDEERGEIYGNFLIELDKPIRYHGMEYPKNIGHSGGANLTRYFPECHMKHLRYLTPTEIFRLKSLSQNNRRGVA